MRNSIDAFTGEFEFLSNFYPSTIRWNRGATLFPTVEHGFVWHKTENAFIRATVLKIVTPGKVKKFGRNITLRPDWDDIKLGVMQALVEEKFQQNLSLARKLIATEDADLIEGNWWNDTYWGVCRGTGENHLGKILMNVRTKLQEG